MERSSRRTVVSALVNLGAATIVLPARPTDDNRASPAITVTTTAASVRQGEPMTIIWETAGAPANSAVALWPVKAITDQRLGPIASGLPATGSYSWQIPVFEPSRAPCRPDPTGACSNDMNPGTTYRIEARLYTPRGANIVVVHPHPTWVAVARSGVFEMLQVRSK
jgi:hypothetical protein